MKFKAVLDHGGLQTFLAVASCMSKVSDECALHLTPETFEFRKKPDESEVEVYASLTAELFQEHTIASKAGDTISLLVGLKNLLNAFNSADHGEAAVIKLTRKHDVPCLTVVADTPAGLKVTQDVPIKRLISRDGMSDYKEPEIGQPTVYCEFPDPRQVRCCLERMATLDKYAFVEFNATKSQLVLRTQTPSVCVRTIFGGRDVTVSDGKRRSLRDGKLTVLINIADLLSTIHFAGVSNIYECALACVEQKALVLFIKFEDEVGTMSHYIPLVDPSDLEDVN